MKNKNPLNPEEKLIPRVEPELETDEFGDEERKKIVDIVLDDYKVGIDAAKEWNQNKELDIRHYNADKPSKLESLDKDDWQSDRNLGLCPAICDAFQAVLLATCYNPDTIHFVANEDNDFANKEQIEKFTKWGLSKAETNAYPDVGSYIHNKVINGFSAFKIYWKVWYEWVDKRIPKEDKAGKFRSYDIKTEKVRFEKGIIENIDDIDDIVIPDFGKTLQDQTFLIHVLHISSEKFKDRVKRNIFKFISDTVDNFVESIKNSRIKDAGGLSQVKAESLGEKELKDVPARVFPIDLIEWYGTYTKGGKTEEYRFIVEPYTRTLLAGKPLRKITRTGKRPFVGGPLIKFPGKVRGKSLPRLIMSVVNAINNVFNQKSDFQFFSNCPFGIHKVTDEGYTKGQFKLKPGVSYPSSSGDPKDFIYFPNLQRSMAWAESDFRFLFEILERLTGAISYFYSTQSRGSDTATRDILVSEKTETKFGLWVKSIQDELCEAFTMWINMYQDWSPPDLGNRVLGEKGRKLFNNLSIKTLRGNYDARMSPDITTGSKMMEKQIMMWGVENLSMSPWVHPQVNPKGNWNLWADAMKKIMGMENVERYLGKEPPAQSIDLEEVNDEWTRFLQGDDFDPPEGATPFAIQHLIGHMAQKEERFHELDEEYRINFEAHLFKTQMNVIKFHQTVRKEKIAGDMAGKTVQNMETQNQGPQGQGISDQGQGAF